MGVAGLWDVLRPASVTRSLTDLAVTDGFETNTNGVRGYRIGIDASIWIFHMDYGREGENPQLRTLFFRCATLMHSPFLPLFVFDGPKRPDFKRGKKISKAPNKLIPSMKQIIEAFGFEHRTAPGEAEAELAYLNAIGVIDGVLSDDVDNFLFGATTVIRNPSNSLSGNRSNPVLNSAGRDDKNHSWVYTLSSITSHPSVRLTRGGLILIGLLSGGDYNTGLERCGMKTAVALAQCGFGDSLFKAATTLHKSQLPAFLDTWRVEMRHEISTNSRGLIGRKSPSLAKALTSAFPDIEVLLSYVDPITSESMGKPYMPGDIKWDREPDISKLAAVCEFYFEWGYKESIIKRFRTVIWHSAVQRILRRAVLDLDQGKRRGGASATTPTRTRRMIESEPPSGTPSKMIAQYFSTMDLNEHQRDTPEDRLLIKIHSTRTHVSTDGLLEYRVEIAPAQLVRLAEHGIQGTREKPVEEWASDDEAVDKDVDGDDAQASKDPTANMRVWMPACMVRMVEPGLVQDFDDEVARKAAKKANQGQGRGRKKKVVAEDGEEDEPASPPKAKPKKVTKPRKVTAKDVGDDDEIAVSAPRQKAAASKTASTSTTTTNVSKSKGKAKVTAGFSSDEDLSDEELPSPSRLFGDLGKAPSKRALRFPNDDDMDIFNHPVNDVGPSPSPRRRVGVRDLTKKSKTKSVADGSLTMNASTTSPSTKTTSTATQSTSTVAISSAAPHTSATVGKAKMTTKKISSSSTKTSTTTTTTKTLAVSASITLTPTKKKPAAFSLMFFDDVDNDDDADNDDDSLDYDDLFTSPPHSNNQKTSTTSKSTSTTKFSTASSSSISASITTLPPSPSESPSKSRSYHQRKSSLTALSSDSDSQYRYRKSPKKSRAHESPVSSDTTRSASPTPQSRVVAPAAIRGSAATSSTSGATTSSIGTTATSNSNSKPPSRNMLNKVKKKLDVGSMPVYEISSESEDADVAQKAIPKPKPRPKPKPKSTVNTSSRSAAAASVPPLMRARGRAQVAKGEVIDFIDLT